MRNITMVAVNAGTGARIILGSGGVGSDGRFVLSALPPGTYTLVGRAAENGAGEGDAMPYFAEAEFVLTDQNLSGIIMQFERGVAINVPCRCPATNASASSKLVSYFAERYIAAPLATPRSYGCDWRRATATQARRLLRVARQRPSRRGGRPRGSGGQRAPAGPTQTRLVPHQRHRRSFWRVAPQVGHARR